MGNVLAVFRFEWRRALCAPRMAWWFVLVLFPILICSLIRHASGNLPREPWSGFIFALIPMLVTMLGTFLWTAPAISAELERQSWVYLAVRPGGKTAVLLGKYLAAVTWVLPAAILSLTICTWIAQPEVDYVPEGGEALPHARQMWWAVARLACLSCPAYAALYLLLGTLFTKRSMVVAVVYTFLFELVVSLVPAVINKLTVQYRLRALMVDWANIDVNGGEDFISAELIGNSPPTLHVAVLLAYTLALLIAAVCINRHREYTAAAAGDV
jgi:ABC-type transport system involved in multi-copper enzyme maturation permease subunit